MGGFKDIVINEKIASNILKDIMVKTLACCQLMIQDCKARGEKINNLEEDIRDYLYCNYLNNDEIIENVGLSEFRFYPEVPENYKNSKPKGRIDLQVFSIAMFNCRNMYFTIECKRINGSKKLNRFYLEKGVERFVGKSPLYPSYFKMNCMFGFVVKNIDIDKNTCKINELQSKEYPNIIVKDEIQFLLMHNNFKSTYSSTYLVNGSSIKLYHLFSDFSSIVS